MIIQRYFFLICSVLAAINVQSQINELTVEVRDNTASTLMEFANIFIVQCSCGGTTERAGIFKINLEENEYSIITSMIGYENDTTTIFLNEKKLIKVKLSPTGYLLENITVTGEQSKDNINRTVMGVQRLSSEKMRLLPTAAGEVDVLSSLSMLAGVGSAGEASNGLSVRGGSLDQNLVLMDYAPIFNPTHLFGLFSIFTPEAVGSVDLYRSNMPSRYGGRISSVVDVKVKDPNAEQLNLSGGIGFASTRFSLETPIIKNKLTILASTRFFYNDFLFSAIDELKNTKANFIDGTIKLKYLPNEKNSFFFTGFFSNDFYQLDISSKINSITSSSNQYDYTTINGTLNWLHTIGTKASIRTTLVNSDYSPKILFPQEGNNNVITYESRIQYRSLQSEFAKEINVNWKYLT
ncbi:MAG: carboxypeptidase-like regulatory domain-containing protein, partial [Saprospiraceae bacterium]|nr:carboxypeptidase-like regulatory domain-containing protein [Saprospiraceae bacterium]